MTTWHCTPLLYAIYKSLFCLFFVLFSYWSGRTPTWNTSFAQNSQVIQGFVYGGAGVQSSPISSISQISHEEQSDLHWHAPDGDGGDKTDPTLMDHRGIHTQLRGERPADCTRSSGRWSYTSSLDMNYLSPLPWIRITQYLETPMIPIPSLAADEYNKLPKFRPGTTGCLKMSLYLPLLAQKLDYWVSTENVAMLTMFNYFFMLLGSCIQN